MTDGMGPGWNDARDAALAEAVAAAAYSQDRRVVDALRRAAYWADVVRALRRHAAFAEVVDWVRPSVVRDRACDLGLQLPYAPGAAQPVAPPVPAVTVLPAVAATPAPLKPEPVPEPVPEPEPAPEPVPEPVTEPAGGDKPPPPVMSAAELARLQRLVAFVDDTLALLAALRADWRDGTRLGGAIADALTDLHRQTAAVNVLVASAGLRPELAVEPPDRQFARRFRGYRLGLVGGRRDTLAVRRLERQLGVRVGSRGRWLAGPPARVRKELAGWLASPDGARDVQLLIVCTFGPEGSRLSAADAALVEQAAAARGVLVVQAVNLDPAAVAGAFVEQYRRLCSAAMAAN